MPILIHILSFLSKTSLAAFHLFLVTFLLEHPAALGWLMPGAQPCSCRHKLSLWEGCDFSAGCFQVIFLCHASSPYRLCAPACSYKSQLCSWHVGWKVSSSSGLAGFHQHGYIMITQIFFVFIYGVFFSVKNFSLRNANRISGFSFTDLCSQTENGTMIHCHKHNHLAD